MDKKRPKPIFVVLFIALFVINFTDIIYTAVVHHKADVSSIIICSGVVIVLFISVLEVRRNRQK